MKKERYIPTGYQLSYIHEGTQFLVYTRELAGALYGIAYKGKAGNPVWHYRFKTKERLQEEIESTVRGLEAHKAATEARRKARYAPHGLQGGEVFRTSWGYEQTNVEYYEVVGVKGQTVELREIAQNRTTEGYECGKTQPIPGAYIGEVFSRRVSMVGGSPSVKVHQSATAYLEQPFMTGGMPIYKERYWSAYY